MNFLCENALNAKKIWFYVENKQADTFLAFHCFRTRGNHEENLSNFDQLLGNCIVI